MKKLSILALALSVLAVSCNKAAEKAEPGGAEAGVITVTARVNNVTKAVTIDNVTTFEYGDQLTLYVWTGDNTAVPDDLWINGEVVTYDKDTQLWEPKNLMLWKNMTDAHYFLGVYPARAITNFTADQFEQNLDPGAKYDVNDLLVATELTGIKAQDTKSVDLAFDHLMAKFNVSVRFRDQWGGIPENVEVSIKGAATGTVDYISKTVTPGNDVTQMPVVWRSTDLQDPVTYYCSYVIPQTGITEVVVNIDGTKYIYTNPADIPFAKGHATTLPLVVGKDAIELADEGITIGGWNDGEVPAGLDENASAIKNIDLSTLKADCLAIDGAILTGTLNVEDYPVKISIVPGATVTLNGVTINGVNDAKYKWAGITCLGDATIILEDGTTNIVKGFHEDAPGIFIAQGKTLVIKGNGSLKASPFDGGSANSYGAGIGGGKDVACGNIEIQGGDVTAKGGGSAAGIGGGSGAACGNITITTPKTNTLFSTKGPSASFSVGSDAACGTVTVGSMVTGSIPTATYMYPINLSTLTANVIAGNGALIFETLSGKFKVSIDDGATVILDNATISYSSKGADYPGLTLIGDGTIQLADGTTNTAIGGLDNSNYSNWPGIFVPEGKTLTINGNTGVLIAARGGDDVDDGSPAGIGAAWKYNCGNIIINGGVINATGGACSAGIGGTLIRTCGDITINGGTVTATGNKCGTGIGLGGPKNNTTITPISGGKITITDGTVVATGGWGGAGIGTGYIRPKSGTMTITGGDILISGGTVTATGGEGAAGIGTGSAYTGNTNNCGTITITDGVTLVTATKGAGAVNSIGQGTSSGTCGTVTIGGTVYPDGITKNPYIYPEQKGIADATAEDVGKVIGANGIIYDNAEAAANASTTAVAIIAYVGAAGSVDASSATYKGLAIAMSDANSGSECQWAEAGDGFENCLNGIGGQTDAIATALGFMNGITCTSTLTAAGHSSHGHTAATAAAYNNGTTAPTGTSGWFMPSMGQWNLIVQGLATKKAGSAVTTDLEEDIENNTYKANNLNSVITDAGGTGLKADSYWASTEENLVRAWTMDFWHGYATNFAKSVDGNVRSIIAF